MAKIFNRQAARKRRKRRVRKKIFGTKERPRLSVFRSQSNISVQVIDDSVGKTLLSASTNDRTLRDSINNGGNTQAANEVGKCIAKKARKAGIECFVLDRGGYVYHGRVKALADGVRENGLRI